MGTAEPSDQDLLARVDDPRYPANVVEADMIDSMMKQVEAGRRLTEKQRAWLLRLYDQQRDRAR